MPNGRTRAARALAALCITGLGGAAFTGAPSTADPSIDDVQDRVDHLYHEAEQASERYNQARIDLSEARRRLAAVQTDLDRQRQRVDAVREQVAENVVAQYQGQALSAATQVLLADDPDAFLSQLTTMSELDARRAGVVQDLSVEAQRLELRQEVVQRELDTIEQARTRLAEEKAEIDRRMEDAKALLGRLEEEQRERELRASRSESRLPMTTSGDPAGGVPASGRAGAAISYALGQVGDAYVFGAAGPSAFDCSGLTMAAWAQAGVSLPHSSAAQMGSGTPVSVGALQPGDLVFYYSPVSHVAMYIGNGMIVHAANPSSGVLTAPVGSMPIAGAVRPG